MKAFAFTAALLALPVAAHAANSGTPEQLQSCRVRQIELAHKIDAYQGDERMKRLMEADLRRANREETEGDGDECLEALDHAAKLLAGDA